MSVVLGSSYARVVAKLANRTFTYNLPLTNLDGRQIEEYEVKKIRHELQNLDITSPEIEYAESILGYRIRWNFSYATFIDGADVQNILGGILTRAKQGYTLTLYPRIDEEWRSFEVKIDSESFALGINRNATFNTDLVLRLVTKNLEPDLKIQVAQPDYAGGFILTFN